MMLVQVEQGMPGTWAEGREGNREGEASVQSIPASEQNGPFYYTGGDALQPQGLQPAHQLPQGLPVKAPHGDFHNQDLPPQCGQRRPGLPAHHQQRELEALHQGLPR